MQVTMIDERTYAQTMTDMVVPALEQCRTEGWFAPATAERAAGLEPLVGDVIGDSGSHPGQLHYLCYDAAKFDAIREEGATATFRGAVVISHGFTEFAEKYDELVWYFLLAGYSVCVLDHRGHGKSARNVENRCMVWIDDWRRYVVDLAAFAQTIGQQYAAGMPLNLFCHSMGGGIGAAVLEQYPTLFDKAVLSAPMIAPATGMPLGVARVLVGVLCKLGFSHKRVFGQGDFTPEFSMKGNEGASEARERWYFKLRCENPEYQTYCAAFEWVRQALKLNRAILSPSACSEVETPILLFQSGRDIWVLNKPQNRFVELVKDGGGEATIVRFPESRHEIFSMPNSTFRPYLEQILKFYDDPMIASASY
ncbi:alpha/beta fold hydrolase [Bifidobacterium callitrichidarum]|uniref:Lysophospholipase n=1 Tax=Bifidobacterium callitrichidarum TaxID=2052941 RepID=A0A2U2ND23_9BIFI|nr:alpha/beta fold hydrolase [Bifidobacterium callitrichidarum]PWG67022.1 lysophospholipase [Bifidobacterium callitrichidarum]